MIGHRGAHVHHLADDLVTGHHSRAVHRKIALGDVQIGATHPARPNPDQQLVRGRLRDRQLDRPQRAADDRAGSEDVPRLHDGGCVGHVPRMNHVDTWIWIALVTLAVLTIPFLAIRRAAKSRVDPTNVSIDADLAHRVRVLCRQDKKVEAVKELRDATGLALRDALTIVEKLAASDPRKRG